MVFQIWQHRLPRVLKEALRNFGILLRVVLVSSVEYIRYDESAYSDTGTERDEFRAYSLHSF